jgi:hypothetical protein
LNFGYPPEHNQVTCVQNFVFVVSAYSKNFVFNVSVAKKKLSSSCQRHRKFCLHRDIVHQKLEVVAAVIVSVARNFLCSSCQWSENFVFIVSIARKFCLHRVNCQKILSSSCQCPINFGGCRSRGQQNSLVSFFLLKNKIKFMTVAYTDDLDRSK